MLFLRRINILKIVDRHWSTFYNDNNNKPCLIEILFVFVGIPVSIAYLLISHPINFPDKFYESIIQVFAIIGGFLINSVIFLADKKENFSIKKSTPKSLTIIKETYYNASYGIVVSFLSVFFCAIYFLTSTQESKALITWIVLSLLWYFSHTMFMVLKRLLGMF